MPIPITKIKKAQGGLNLSTFRANTSGLMGAASNNLLQGSQPQLAGAPKFSKIPGGGAGMGNIAGGIGMLADLGASAVDAFAKPGKVNSFGIMDPNQKAMKASSALGMAGKGASAGASLGMAAGPLGALIGAGVGAIGGGIMGLLKGKKNAKAAKKDYLDNTQLAYESYNQKANSAQYAALAKYGAKLSAMKKVTNSKKKQVTRKGKFFKKYGGKLDSVGEVNIIPGGVLHKENNNLGKKDKGIPIVDTKGTKVFEVEKEELILRLKATEKVEELVGKYKSTNNTRHLIELGKYLAKEITTNTEDLSGKYDLKT